MSRIEDLKEKFNSNNWDIRLKASDELAVIGTNESLTFLKEQLRSEDNWIRNAAVLGLMETRKQEFFLDIMKRIIELGHDEEIGTMVYALENFDCSGYLKVISELHLYGNAEVKVSTSTILTEQRFKLHQNELKTIENIFSDHGLSFEKLGIQYDLIDFPIVRINSTGKLFNVTLRNSLDWDVFYETADRITHELDLKFTEKVEDVDSKYWDFEYESKIFTLHYHSMVGDVDLLTEFKNGIECFESLLIRLKYNAPQHLL